MSSIFTGKNSLRHRYDKLTHTQLAGATTAASAVILTRFHMGGRIAFIDNTLNAEAALLLVHPEKDAAVVSNRLLWLEIGADRVYNLDLSSAIGLEIDPGTTLLVYTLTAATSGSIKIGHWS